MPTEKVTMRESVRKPNLCPTKHRRAYKTSFGNKLYCPDCGHNVEGEKNGV